MEWFARPIRLLGHPVSIGSMLLLFGLVAFSVPVLRHWVHNADMAVGYSDIISICAFVATVVIAVFSVIPNLRQMAESSRSSHYSELDNMYLRLLTMAVDKPYLRTPDALEANQVEPYKTYAFMVWNFLETIHDRCAEDPRLRDTWGPVIATEFKVHWKWFRDETAPYSVANSPKFCIHFCDFIWTHFPFSSGDIPEAPDDKWMEKPWAYRRTKVITASVNTEVWRLTTQTWQPVGASQASPTALPRSKSPGSAADHPSEAKQP